MQQLERRQHPDYLVSFKNTKNVPQLKQEQGENKTHPVSSRVSRFSGSVTSRQTDPNTTAKPPFIIKMTTCHHTDLLSNRRSRCSSRALQKGNAALLTVQCR